MCLIACARDGRLLAAAAKVQRLHAHGVASVRLRGVAQEARGRTRAARLGKHDIGPPHLRGAPGRRARRARASPRLRARRNNGRRAAVCAPQETQGPVDNPIGDGRGGRNGCAGSLARGACCAARATENALRRRRPPLAVSLPTPRANTTSRSHRMRRSRGGGHARSALGADLGTFYDMDKATVTVIFADDGRRVREHRAGYTTTGGIFGACGEGATSLLRSQDLEVCGKTCRRGGASGGRSRRYSARSMKVATAR